MPRRATPAPKHRATPADRAVRTPVVPRHRAPRTPVSAQLVSGSATVTRTALFSGVAIAATGVTVTAGISASDAAADSPDTAAAALLAAAQKQQPVALDQVAELDADRTPVVSRSDRRSTVDATKASLLSTEATSGGQVTRSKDLGGGDPRQVARALLGEFGFGSDQFGCLDSLWTRESGWNTHADNPSSSAYGIPQALPGSKMASAGPDWADNPATQIRWGLGYIASRYGSPCGAWGHSQSYGWY